MWNVYAVAADLDPSKGIKVFQKLFFVLFFIHLSGFGLFNMSYFS